MLLPVSNEFTFFLSVKGESTGLKYEGTFKVKCLLTNAEKVDIGLRIDAYNRGSKTVATGISILNATIAELDVRIMESPSFWKDSDYGRQLMDTNVVYEVFKKANDAEEDFKKRLKEIADAAEKQSEETVKKRKEKQG
jgi:hypothetical protein